MFMIINQLVRICMLYALKIFVIINQIELARCNCKNHTMDNFIIGINCLYINIFVILYSKIVSFIVNAMFVRSSNGAMGKASQLSELSNEVDFALCMCYCQIVYNTSFYFGSNICNAVLLF